MFNHYTSTYTDDFTQRSTISLYKPVISPEGNLKGTSAGRVFVVDRQGQILLHPDAGAMFRHAISTELMESMTSGEGSIYARQSRTWYWYYAFTNPEWFVIYKVSGATLSDLAGRGSSGYL